MSRLPLAALPAPPPPATPTNKSLAGKVAFQREPSIWPYRLLHVKSMTSYVRQGENIYNSIKEPPYNIISYTWGRFMDPDSQETQLLVHGIDWPIPSIRRTHFSARAFQDAIERAAGGFRHRCDWLWVDIACIRQQHDRETPESANIRDQEIARQWEIFQRAREVFAWLSSLETGHIIEHKDGLITVNDLVLLMDECPPVFHTEEAALEFIETLEEYSCSFTKSMTTVLAHAWFESLWTLQEMILRSGAFVLFDDGLLDLRSTDEDEPDPWILVYMRFDLAGLRENWGIPDSIEKIADAAILFNETSDNQDSSRKVGKVATSLARVKQHLGRLVRLLGRRGFGTLDSTFPHNAYSMAHYRKASRKEDRIYGITQVYGISCGPLPPGGDPTSRLHALEDEFGEKLVDKPPLLSQLYIHGNENQEPRRSWLVTQECKVDDSFWNRFDSAWSTHLTSSYHVTSLFESLRVVRGGGASNQEAYLQFIGKTWCLDTFVQCDSSSVGELFAPRGLGNPVEYRGLMLDQHVSKAALSEVVDYFPDRESMVRAVQKLHQHYRITGPESTQGFGGVSDQAAIQVTLLASSSTYDLPVVDYVALVLAPSSKVATSGGCVGDGGTDIPETMMWKRIGLMRWTETYHDDRPITHQPHLPQARRFSGLIE